MKKKSPNTVRQRLTLLMLPKHLQDKVHDGQLKTVKALEILRMQKVSEPTHESVQTKKPRPAQE